MSKYKSNLEIMVIINLQSNYESRLGVMCQESFTLRPSMP
jgi:hypothetical protein